MLTKYIEAAMKRAKYEKLDDNEYAATVPGLDGLWASASSLEECQAELRDVLESWLIVKLRHNHHIPPMGRISLGRPLSKSA